MATEDKAEGVHDRARRAVELDAARTALKSMEDGHKQIVEQLQESAAHFGKVEALLTEQLAVMKEIRDGQAKQETLWSNFEKLAAKFSVGNRGGLGSAF